MRIEHTKQKKGEIGLHDRLTKRDNETQKEEDRLIKKLENRANKGLEAFAGDKWEPYLLGSDTTVKNYYIKVDSFFKKLFEGHIIQTEEKMAKYVFQQIVGYNEKYDCPQIIVRDSMERVVDLIVYRPKQDAKLMDKKYLFCKKEYKPYQGGKDFLFLFQEKMMRIIDHERYCFIGTGVKNALNSLIVGIPFIAIQSNIKEKQIEFLNSSRMEGITLIAAMDTSTKGKKLYEELNSRVKVSKNMFDFDIDIYFAKYLREKINKGLDDDKKQS